MPNVCYFVETRIEENSLFLIEWMMGLIWVQYMVPTEGFTSGFVVAWHQDVRQVIPSPSSPLWILGVVYVV